MKYVEEYRAHETAQKYVDLIHRTTTKNWRIMEVCGGQTHGIIKFGLDQLLPKKIELIHGPGCPVCVTPQEKIDLAIEIAHGPDVIFCTFGDMLRVPGSEKDLTIGSNRDNVKVVYSPLDALKIAQENRNKRIVFFAIGFETTAPANAMAVWQAKKLGIENFSMLVSHVRVSPAIEAILDSDQTKVNGFLAAGHVCTVMGYDEYPPIVEKYRVPIVVTGFEPIDILQGILMVIQQLENGIFEIENQYARSVRKMGNVEAKKIIDEVFEIADQNWRGIGAIPMSGFRLRDEFRQFDAEAIFQIRSPKSETKSICISGEILKGIKKPIDCPAFGTECSPRQPLGATMVSSEGACAAYFRYGRIQMTNDE